MPTCFVTSEAPVIATELSFGPAGTELHVEADAPSPDRVFFKTDFVLHFSPNTFPHHHHHTHPHPTATNAL